MAKRQVQTGFTLIEALVTIAIIATLFAVSVVNLGPPQVTGSLGSAVDTLVSDLKSQQLLAMAGNQGGQPTAQPQGIALSPSDYTLFAGTSLDLLDDNNYVVTPAAGISITTSFADDQVVFGSLSGEVEDFVDGDNTITLSLKGETKTITVGRFGAVEIN